MPSIDGVLASIEGSREEMIGALRELLRIPAIGPENGGDGEFERARYLKELVERSGFEDVEMFDALDERVRLRLRPNIVARRRGRSDQTVWIVTHMDTVPPGDLDAWTYPPFSPREDGGKLFGLGAEDNGQGIIASLFACRALNELGLEADRSIGLAIVSDEEATNEKGVKFLIGEGVFSDGDIIYVPDFGVPDGSAVEVAEKSIIWMKVAVEGRQAHASTPEEGLNAMRVGSEFMVYLLSHLREKFPKADQMFIPPTSTFEPTKRLQTVGNINTVPGEDVFYLDFRVLPVYEVESVLNTVKLVAEMFEDKTGAGIQLEVEQLTRAARPSDTEGIGIRALTGAIRKVREIEPRTVGIGGGTCANIFRGGGFDAYVWQTVDRRAHSVDEYCRIDNLIADAKVFATTIAALCYRDEISGL